MASGSHKKTKNNKRVWWEPGFRGERGQKKKKQEGTKTKGSRDLGERGEKKKRRRGFFRGGGGGGGCKGVFQKGELAKFFRKEKQRRGVFFFKRGVKGFFMEGSMWNFSKRKK